MKHIFPLILCVCLLVGCGQSSLENWTPSTASAEIEPYARRAVEILDKYLNFQMTADEANDAFDELYTRMGGYDVNYDKYRDSDIDWNIAYSIIMLALDGIERHSDMEIRQHRDELAFQIGEPVSGYIYPAGHSVPDNDPLYDLVDVEAVPFYFGFVRLDESDCHCGLNFDEMNVPEVAELQSYMEYVFACLLTEEKTNTSLSVYYSRFGQDVFSVSIRIYENEFSGKVYRNDEAHQAARDLFLEKYSLEERAEMEGYPKEFDILNPIFEFDSIEGLEEALTVAAKFAGLQ